MRTEGRPTNLQFIGVVRAVDDVAIMLDIELRLGTQLASEELDRVRGRTGKGLRHLHRVHHHRLDPIAFPLHLYTSNGGIRGRKTGERI